MEHIYTKLFALIKQKSNDEFKTFYLSIDKTIFNINMIDKSGKSLLNYAILTNNYDMVIFLIDNKIKIDANEDSMSILSLAISNYYNDIVKLLIEKDKDIIGQSIINQRDKNNNIPLHYAIKYENIEAIDLLLDNGGNVNLYDNNKQNSLFFAVKTKKIDICNKILKNITNINLKNNMGENVLNFAILLDLFDVAKLLIDRKIEQTQDLQNEYSPLHFSLYNNNISTTKLLLDGGGNINAQDIYGNTPLHGAIEENNNEVIKYVLSKIYDKINVNLWNINGEILLHKALKQKNFEIVKYLLEKSNINLQDSDGNSCMYYLIKNKWKEDLEKKKIDIFLKNNKNKYLFEYLDDEYFEIVVSSYYYRLKNKNKQWNDIFDINCLSQDEKTCKNEIRQKLKSMMDKPDIKCNIKSYPIIKPPMCISLTENNNNSTQFCTFTGSVIDIFLGLIYLTKKHNNVCTVIPENNIDKCINYKLKKNFGNFNDCELINFEIIWSNKELYIGKSIENVILTCNKDYIIIPLGIEMDMYSHTNYLIYDVKNNELERFESHGGIISIAGENYNSNLLDIKIEKKFKEYNENIKYFKPNDFLPKISFQFFDSNEKHKKKIGDPQGFCAVWSIWYADFRLSHTAIKREKIVKILLNEIKTKNISFKNMIRNYSQNIITIRDTIFEKANLNINDWMNDEITDDQIIIVMKEINILIKNI